MQYNAPEGFSSQPNDPYQRILELQQVITLYHEAASLIIDVVYNHAYLSDEFAALSRSSLLVAISTARPGIANANQRNLPNSERAMVLNPHQVVSHNGSTLRLLMALPL